MQNAKISIVIPTFNEEKYLPACLDSILNVDYPKELIEIIVVDNGSTDRTREIANKYKVKLFRDDSKNVSGLRNLGVEQSSGEIIAFIDADCVASKDWLKNAACCFDNLELAAWGAPPGVPSEATWVQKAWNLVRCKGKNLAEVDWLESMNLFVRKKQFLEISGFDESLITCEDVDLSYRIKRFGKIISDNRIQVFHYGEAATVRQFIRKEVWRGIGNFKGIFSHGVTLKELPSLMIPIYFGIVIPINLIGCLITWNSKWIAALLILYLVPTLFLLIKIQRKTKTNLIMLMKLSFLLHVYFLARTIAVVRSSHRYNKSKTYLKVKK